MHYTFTKTHLVLVILCFLIASLLRLVALGSVPKGLHEDEASFLVNTLSLSQSMRDEDGRFLPLYLTSFIDPKPALFSYLQLPFVWLSPSLNTSIIRLPSALLGILSVGLIFLLANRLLNRKLAIIILALTAISPWHIVVSRSTQEVILSFVFVVSSMLCLSKLFPVTRLPPKPLSSRQTTVLLFGFFVSVILAMYSYHSAKPFILIMTGIWILLSNFGQKKVHLKTSLTVLLGTGFVFSFFFWGMKNSLTRFNEVSIFSEKGPDIINQDLTMTVTPVSPYLLIRVLYNKVSGYGLAILGVYAQHFTVDFLFLHGGQPNRYIVPFHGLLYVIEFPFLLFGLFRAFHQPKFRSVGVLLLSWLLVGPLAASLTTQEVPSVIRSFLMIVPLLFFVALGLDWGIEYILICWQKKKHATALHLMIGGATLFVAGTYLWCILYFLQQFFVVQALYHPWHRDTAKQQLSLKVPQYMDQYQRILIASDAQVYPYFLLQGLISPHQLQTSYPARLHKPFEIGAFSFQGLKCETLPDERVLSIVKAGCEVPLGFSVIDQASFDDGVAEYQFLRYDKRKDPMSIEKK